MPVVSNTGPLIALARIRKTDLLPQLFGEVLVPEAVWSELTAKPTDSDSTRWARLEWLWTSKVEDALRLDSLRRRLDLGESEAILLAQERSLTLVIDERRGRRLAKSRGVETTGTVGVLIAAKRSGLLAEVDPWLERLVTRGIRLSAALRAEARKIAGEE